MKKPATAGLVLTFAISAFALTAVPATATSSSDGAKAKTLFTDTHKCGQCHAVAAEGIAATIKMESMKGPDLSGFKTDKPLEAVAAYVRKEAELDGKSHKKPFKGTDEELQAILDWLGSLEAQK